MLPIRSRQGWRIVSSRKTKPSFIMKKLLLLSLSLLLPSLGALGQGYFIFANSTSTAIWEGFTTPNTYVRAQGTAYVAMLYSTDTTAAPLTGGVATPTNAPNSASWSPVLTDP